MCGGVRLATHVHQEVEEASIEGFGKSIAAEVGLFHVEGDIDDLLSAAPFAVHLAAGQFLLEALLVDGQEVGGEGQDCREGPTGQ